MKRQLRILTTGVITAAAAAGIVFTAARYRAGGAFQPIGSNRELQNNQVLFPDSDAASGAGEDGGDEDSYWEEENADEETGLDGSNPGYLFGRDEQTPDGAESGGILTDGPGGETAEIPDGGVYEITDRDDGNADIILPGGTAPGGEHEPEQPEQPEEPQQPENPGDNGGTDPGTGGGTLPGGNTEPDNGGGSSGGNAAEPEIPAEPVPGYGSASKDQPNTDYVKPSFAGTKDEHFSSSTAGKLPEDEANYEVRFGKAYDANAGAGEALYRGQTVDLVTLFQSLEAFVWDYNTGCNYYWTLDDLMQSEADEDTSYVRIDGYSFGVFGTRFDAETTYPFTIPEDEYYLNIYISYRFSLDDDWTSYSSGWSDGVFYELMSSRVIALDTILRSEGEVIDPAHIANLYNQYLDGWTDSINLLQFQNKIIGARGTRLESLFPGWKEDGELVPFVYTADAGRHVLEPAGRVPLSEDYQVEVENQWVSNDYTIGASTDIFSSAKWSALQTLTRYLGRDAADNSVERLSVPQYVQAVDFLYYPGLTTDYLELPETVIYVNTNGVPSFMDDWLLYDRGLAVSKGYTVAEGNPRYAAEDGILYNLDRSEILGVPTEREELIVGSGVTHVLLPYQNALKFLVLDLESLDTLPEVNYERLAKTCRIVVPDALLNGFMSEERDMLQQTGLLVVPYSQWASGGGEEGYVLRDNFLLTGDGALHEVLRENAHWLSLPDYVREVESAALEKYAGQLAVLLLPADGSDVTFDAGCFDPYEKLTIACYSENQEAAAEMLSALYPDCDLTIRRVTVREDGYAYLETENGVLLCAVPEGLTEFRGYIPGAEGGEDIPVATVSENVFAGSITLRWAILPEHVKGIGFRAFADCSNLEGVLIDSRDVCLLAEQCFDNCASLRFVASNAKKVQLECADFALDTENFSGSYGFLYCLDNIQGYNGNWISISDADSFSLLDCGGAYVLYTLDKNGTPLAALRSGRIASGKIGLPLSTVSIYREAFQGVRMEGDGMLELNLTELTALRQIWQGAFLNSDLGGDVVLPKNLNVQRSAFSGCEKLVSIYLPGETDWSSVAGGGIILGDELFYGCSALTTVRLGDFASNSDLYPNVFSGSGVQNIIFEGINPPRLLYYTFGFPFYFEYDREEAGELRITVPEGYEDAYIQAWRCDIAGYGASASAGGKTSYQLMWDDLEFQLTDQLWRDPTPGEVREAVDALLLSSENRVRALLGLDALDAPTRSYYYTLDDEGFLTLTATDRIGEYTGLTAEEMDMPSGWTLDYIGADAFAGSPELRTVVVPSTLAALRSNAFRGLQFDEADLWDSLMLVMDSAEQIFALSVEQPGVPFDFGVEDGRISLVLFDDTDALETLIRLWTAPLAGWNSTGELEACVRAQLGEAAGTAAVRAEMERILLAGENRVRALLGAEPTESLTMSFDLTETEEPGTNIPDPDENEKGETGEETEETNDTEEEETQEHDS